MKSHLGLLLSLLLAGCLPMPHFSRVVPNVIGTLTHNGTPIQGATIFVHRKYSANIYECLTSSENVQTDAVGHFSVSQLSDFHFFQGLIGDPVSTWAICINYQGTLYTGWRNLDTGYAKDRIDLTCELADNIKICGRDRGICSEKAP
jgi:hypothetical protein